MTSLVVGSTFSGVGGLDLGLEQAGHRVAFQCEFEPYRRRVLARHWPRVPCFDDVREIDAERLQHHGIRGVERARGGDDAVEEGLQRREDAAVGIDLLCGGFPCQDLSVAGKRRGLSGERSSLFFEFARIADELVRSGGWVLVENVPGLLSGCSCVGCEKCRDLLRLHSRGWRLVGGDAGRDPRGGGGQLGFADDLAGGGGDGSGSGTESSRRSSGRCPCRRCDAARSLLAAHDGTEFSVVRSVLGEIGFHDLAWRVLDSRYLGVPQRRRRVFILARRARGRRAAEILLEPESGGGNFEAGRGAKARVASPLTRGSSRPGVSDPGRRREDDFNIVSALDRKGGGADDNDAQAGHLVAGTVRSHVRPGSSDAGGVVPYTVHAAESGAKERHAFETNTARSLDRAGGFATNQGGNLVGTTPDPDGVREASGTSGRVDVGSTCPFDPRPDAARYAACGDAVTVNVAAWIGRRLAELA